MKKIPVPKIIAVIAFSAAASLASAAHAQEFPSWPLSATCDTAELHCPRYEVHARGKVSGVWPSLPPKVRTQCLSEIRALQPSYRLLHNCLANAMQELLKNQARNPPTGKVVHLTPKAKPKAPPPPAAEPAPRTAPASPAVPQ